MVREEVGGWKGVKKCVETGRVLGREEIEKCRQCQLYRIKGTGKKNICRICWG